jgi:hypothetical protein
MKGAFSAPGATVRVVHGAPGHRRTGRKVDARSALSGAARRGRAASRAKGVGGLEVKVPLVEPFTRPGA